MNKKELYIIGAGGLGREIAATFKHSNFTLNYDSIFYIDNNLGEINGIKIIGNNKTNMSRQAITALSAGVRKIDDILNMEDLSNLDSDDIE